MLGRVARGIPARSPAFLPTLAPASRVAGIQHRGVTSPEHASVYLHVEVLREIEGVAKAFAASPSAVVNLAWLAARKAGRAS